MLALLTLMVRPWFPVVLGNTIGATGAQISSPECYSGSHHCMHNASVLTCICTMRPSRTWSISMGMFHRPLLKAATHHQYIVHNMCSNPSICPSSFLQAYNVTPFKGLKLFNRSTYRHAFRGGRGLGGLGPPCQIIRQL